MEEVNHKDQKITFCGVGAHHQHGIIKNKNKMLTLSVRTLLLHGIRMWPQMIDTMFWPFAFKAAAERHNCLSITKTGKHQYQFCMVLRPKPLRSSLSTHSFAQCMF
jgi:hypothetical protein